MGNKLVMLGKDGNNTIREDDELLEELSLRRKNSKPTHLSHETKVYIDKVF